MAGPLRDIKLVRNGSRQRTSNLIGLDESTWEAGETRYTIIVAVRAAREDEVALLRELIDNELQPFRHKSSSLRRHKGISEEERAERVEQLIGNLENLPVSWSAVLWEGPDQSAELAASAVMAAKKSITNPLQVGEISYGCGETAFLHDGKEDAHSKYFEELKLQLPSAFDSSFQRAICPVFLTFLQDADRIYPVTNTADYIAGYLRQRHKEHDGEFTMPRNVYDFDPSWVDPAPQAEEPYQLDSISPLQEQELRSRVLAWLFGKGIPASPDPTNQDPYRSMVTEIEDEVVREYLLTEL